MDMIVAIMPTSFMPIHAELTRIVLLSLRKKDLFNLRTVCRSCRGIFKDKVNYFLRLAGKHDVKNPLTCQYILPVVPRDLIRMYRQDILENRELWCFLVPPRAVTYYLKEELPLLHHIYRADITTIIYGSTLLDHKWYYHAEIFRQVVAAILQNDDVEVTLSLSYIRLNYLYKRIIALGAVKSFFALVEYANSQAEYVDPLDCCVVSPESRLITAITLLKPEEKKSYLDVCWKIDMQKYSVLGKALSC